eukprot:6251573-Ditylum_brightwellii.AAC.1
MGVTELAESLTPYWSKTGKTMIPEVASIQKNDTDSNLDLLEFKRPFYNNCDSVLTPLPIVHSTCNSIHEISLSASETNSALLSMKGSWRSVWKVDLKS